MAKMDNKEKMLLFGLAVVVLAFTFLTFEGLTFSLVNVGGEKNVMVNSEQTYTIDMQVTPTSQFQTEDHYRIQYGQWNVVDGLNTTIIKGTKNLLVNGTFYNQVTIIIPPGYKKLYFEAFVLEEQYSKTSETSTFLKAGEEIIKTETLTINIIECVEHSDCNQPGLCTGQYGWCNEENTCEIKGDCKECITNDDCSVGFCQNYKCYTQLEVQTTSIPQQLQDTFGSGLTETSNNSKEASPILIILVITAAAILGVLIYRRKKNKF